MICMYDQTIAEHNTSCLRSLLNYWKTQDRPSEQDPVQFQQRHAPTRQTHTLSRSEVIRRARAYLAKIDAAVSGQKGSKPTFHVGGVLTQGFGLSMEEALEAIQEWNGRCLPPWSEADLRHKLEDASKAPCNQSLGWLLNGEATRNGSTRGRSSLNGSPGSLPEKKNDQTALRWRVLIDDHVIADGEPREILPPDDIDHLDGEPFTFQMLTLGTLLNTEFPEPNWIIPGIMSEGLNILAGAPKQGKSILALNLALTVAGGGKALGNIQVTPSDVLYLSLEDKQRRVKARAIKMARMMDPSLADCMLQRLMVTTEWPRQDQGGLRMLDLWCQRVERPGLIIIDVWNRFSPSERSYSSGSAYAQDAEFLGAIKKFADRRSLTVLVIHHTRKPSVSKETADYVHEVSGTLGITGAADGIMVLLRSRHENQAALHITGRDVAEQELVLEFDADNLTWKSLGTSEQHSAGKVRNAVIQLLKSLNGESMFCKDIAERVDEKENSVRQVLNRLREEKMIRKVGNAWAYPGDACPEAHDETGF